MASGMEAHIIMTLTVAKWLALIALFLVIASFVVTAYPLLAVAVLLLCVALLAA